MTSSYSIPQTGWRRIYAQFVDYWMVLHEKTHPQHTTLYYNRLQLMVICNYPNKEQRRSPIRHLWHRIILLQTNLFFVTLLFALPESVDNIVDFGQNILWLISCFYLIFKWHYFYFRADDVDEIINDLDECHCMAVSGAAAPIIRNEQRRFFLIESSLTLAWHVANVVFIVLATSQPLWTDQKLPFNAVYPFEWHDPEKHPIAHAIIYIWQFYFLAYNMACVMYCDVFSSHLFAQLAINLKILCIELDTFARWIGLVRYISRSFRTDLDYFVNRNVNRTNEVFYAPLTMQMLTEILLITLSTFETLAARQDLRVAGSFIIFMLLTFCHCAYFCYFGDMVTEHSKQVAQSAYGAYEWSPNSRILRRDLLFMISRAQQPLSVTPSPFPPFNRITFMSVIKQCYRILTLLMESMD
ncbi:putative odorant receptor 65b [Drosophila mojavensis]|uniref:putative odorant receptor 65b n=1 Tax=Drosophila mojavensis TaxID=7230 RepID=UPI001CD0E7B6|nr:putative odorant receptor 65b [Drosophila mojavensis]